MMSDLIDDHAVEALSIIWDQSLGYSGPRIVDAPHELRVVKDFLSRETWQHFVQFIQPSTLNHHERVMEYSGFRFQSDLDPDDEHFEGVEVFDPLDTIHISERAFDRLMARYFDVIVRGVTTHHLPEAREVWWQAFVANTRLLEERIQNASARAEPQSSIE